MRKGTPKGYWKIFENLEKILRPIIEELGRMPTHKELVARKLGVPSFAIVNYHGGYPAVAARLGVAREDKSRPRSYYLEFENIERVLRPICNELGRMPTDGELRDRKQGQVANALSLHGGARAVGRKLGVGMSSDRKDKKYWLDFARIEYVVRPVADNLKRMPTEQELIDLGFGGVMNAIRKHHGGRDAVCTRLGLPAFRKKLDVGHWDDFLMVEGALRPVAIELGRMPTPKELAQRRLTSLMKSLYRHGGYLAVAARLGLSTERLKLPRFYWDDFANLESVLRPIIQELSRMPTSTELKARNLSSLMNAILKHGGFPAVAARLGLAEGERKPPDYWKNFENLESALMPIVVKLGRMPTHQELCEMNRTPISNAIKRHGGFPAVATRLGLDPVTQSAIEDRADKVAQAYLALGLEDDGTSLWDAMMRRWLTRDLDAALAAFEMDGTLDAFRRLLADP